jgi:hypothetical protein
MATPSASEIGQYFDFGEAAMPDTQQVSAQDVPTLSTNEG